MMKRGKQAIREADARKYEFLEVPMIIINVFYACQSDEVNPLYFD